MTRMERERARRARAVVAGILAIGGMAVALLSGLYSRVDAIADEPIVGPEKQRAEIIKPSEAVDDPEAAYLEMLIDPVGPPIPGPGEVDPEIPPYLSHEIPLCDELQAALIYWADQNGVPYEIVCGVIETESTFRENARNGANFGYMQINKCNFEWLKRDLGVNDPKEGYDNVHCGIYMLGNLYKKYGDWHKALVCYNCGEGGAYKYVFSTGATTSKYSRLVMSRADKWKAVIDRDGYFPEGYDRIGEDWPVSFG